MPAAIGRCGDAPGGMEDGASGSAAGSTTRPAPMPRPTSSRRSPTRRAARRLLPHPRPLRARRPVPRPVPGGDRDRPARRGARPHHPLLPPADVPGHARPDARRWSTTRGPTGSGRHVRRLPLRVGEHPAPDPHPDLGPGRRPGADEGAPRRPRPSETGSARSSRTRGAALRRRRRPPRHPARLLRRPAQPASGRAGPGRADRRPAATIRSTSSATCSSPRASARTRSRPGRTLDGHPAVPAPPGRRWSGRTATFVGDKPSPRTYGSYPRILGQFVRDEGLLGLEEAVAPDDVDAGRPARPPRPRQICATARSPTSWSSTRRRSGATRRSTIRAETPTGIETVIVDGVPVVDGGRHTGATPGRALRRGRD